MNDKTLFYHIPKGNPLPHDQQYMHTSWWWCEMCRWITASPTPH